jgi:hypothetical protein
MELIKVILNQNYFQYNDKYFKPTLGIAMGSPISSALVHTFLQYFEEIMVKHWMEMGEITYYRRYVDDIIIIIISNQNTITEDSLSSYMNNIH